MGLRGRPAAPRAGLPWLLWRRRTVGGVAAYFDLITDDGRLFFGGSFHFGFFSGGDQTLAQALDAHIDLVCELAGIRPRTGRCALLYCFRSRLYETACPGVVAGDRFW